MLYIWQLFIEGTQDDLAVYEYFIICPQVNTEPYSLVAYRNAIESNECD